MKNHLVRWMLLSAVCFFVAASAGAQNYSHVRIVRLSLVQGDVQYQHPGQDWQDAHLNLPIQEGDSLRTGDGYAEVEFEQALSVWLAPHSTMDFTLLAMMNQGRLTRLTVPQGTIAVSAKRIRREDAVVVVSPTFAVSLPHEGRFRLDVNPTDTWVAVFHGKAEVQPQSGSTTLVAGGHSFHEAANGSTEVASKPPVDDFDKWVAQRSEMLSTAESETAGVFTNASYTEGFADLYDYGLWSDLPGYGFGWVPYGMGAGWMPFVNGDWEFMGPLGWTWMSGEPWGWLPYHFGSWVDAPGVGWAWLPVGSPTWTPGNASWVQYNNQLGWVPNAPPRGIVPTPRGTALVPSAVILAAQGVGGIRAGTTLPMASVASNLRAASAPSQNFVAPAIAASAAVAGTPNAAATASASLARTAVFPRIVRAPSAAAFAPARVARLSAAPQAVLAPHVLAPPAFAHGGEGGFRGGFAGGQGGGGIASASQGGFAGSRSVSSAPAATVSHASAAGNSAGASGGGHR